MIVSAMEPKPQTTATVRLADLLLARLLPPVKRAPTPARRRADLARFFHVPPADDAWQETLDELVEAGLLTLRPMRLTDAGRAQALAFLGVGELPPRCNWRTIQARFLVPKALGISAADQEGLKRIKNKDSFTALLLQRRLDLPLEPQSSLTKVFEALACRELGFPEDTTLKDVESRVLSRRLGSEERLDAKHLKQTLPRVLLGTKSSGIGGLRAVLLEGWADGVASPSPQTAALEEPREEAVAVEFDLPAFAGTVKAAGRDCPSGRFGDNKVFINHVWRRLHDEPSFPVKTLAAFKERLIEANSAGLLTLSRADLIQLLDPSDVRESLTPYLNGEFHFLLVEREEP